MRTELLNASDIERTLKRIAYQILEQSFKEEDVIFVGIEPRGTWVADQLLHAYRTISNQPTLMMKYDENDEAKDQLRSVFQERSDMLVILVDDVLNSGKTMMDAAAFITQFKVKRLITTCLVDRRHRRFPIKADFVGLTLATTLQEHITLEPSQNPAVFLD